MQPGHPVSRLALAGFRSYRFLGLLLALLLLLIASTMVGETALDRSVLGILLATVVFAAGFAGSPRRRERWLTAALAVASGAVLVGGLLLDHREIYLPTLALFTAYLVYTILVVVRRMVTATTIDADILCGAAAIYLLLGVAWSVTYWMIYEVNPDAFTHAAARFSLQDFTYYSLSSLTSLGIADIMPVGHFARIWTTLETITGNLYIAVLVSRLVSLYR